MIAGENSTFTLNQDAPGGVISKGEASRSPERRVAARIRKRELKLSENKPPSPEKPPAEEKRLLGLVEVKPEMTEAEMRQAAKELFKQIKGK